MTEIHEVFGVTIASDVALGLPPSASTTSPDLSVRRASGLTPPTGPDRYLGIGADRMAWRFEVSETTATFWFAGAGTLAVHGDDGVIEVEPSGDDACVRRYLLTTALSCALAAQGRLVLHAGSAAGPAGAVAFGGPSGRGKSTAVASLVAAGYACLHDDLTVLTPDWCVQPGPRWMSLLPDAAAALELRGEPDGGEVRVGLAPAGASPLRAVVLLDPRGGEAGIRPLRPAHAAARMGMELGWWGFLTDRWRSLRFELLAQVATRVPCYAWAAPHGVEAAASALAVDFRRFFPAPATDS